MPGAAPDVLGAFDRLVDLRSQMQSGQPIGRAALSREALRTILPGLGITRVGDLTALDDLSIPVWFAARPGSRSLCVSNGKGLTEDAAWFSAVMESAEQALAEQAPRLIECIETPAGLADRGLTSVQLDRQSRCAATGLDDQNFGWVRGISWRTGEAVLAPYELVGLDMASESPWDNEHFRMTSVGLASSGDLLGAILHGLRELVEEDALFAPLTGGVKSTRDMILSRRHDDLGRTVAMLAERGVETLFADITDDIDEPVMMAALRPVSGPESEQTYFCGSACRATREDAALAALIEAAQSRLTFISGARDDLFADEYDQHLRDGTRELFVRPRFIDDPVRRVDARDSLAGLIGKLAAAGSDIYVFPLGGSPYGFEVVRVLADDLVSVDAPENFARSGRAGLKLLRSWGRA